MKKFKLFWRINENIRATEIRVIGQDGKQLGVMDREKALEESHKVGLTLVEIAPNAKPPVAKIVDFGKFKYQEEKRLRKQSHGAKGGDLKEVRFSPFIAEHDFNTHLEKVKGFLNEKNKVRLVVVFKGPQMRVKHTGYDLFKRVFENLGESIAVDMQPKFLGKHLVSVVSPLRSVKQNSGQAINKD